MKQFYETYKDYPKRSTVLREISGSHNSAIFSRCKTIKEKEFYLNVSNKELYIFREKERFEAWEKHKKSPLALYYPFLKHNI